MIVKKDYLFPVSRLSKTCVEELTFAAHLSRAGRAGHEMKCLLITSSLTRGETEAHGAQQMSMQLTWGRGANARWVMERQGHNLHRTETQQHKD